MRSTVWALRLTGLCLFVFGVIALSSPGRIDVVDGHTRYDVGRSLVEHGDSIVRDPNAWFAVLPGRNGQRYTNYRFPHSVVAAAAILVSDFSGPVTEVRRHFFFSLSGAVLAAAIALSYACWFRRMGHEDTAALLWAAGGIFCTPIWFYSTTTFDDVLGSLAIVAAVVFALILAQRWPGAAASVSGLFLGFAFNCKPPLVLFAPVAIAAMWHSQADTAQRRKQIGAVCVGLALGVIAYKAYDLWKFPPGTWATLDAVQGAFAGLWPGNVLAGFLSLLISPGVGSVWYWPAIIIALYGLAMWHGSPSHRRFAWAVGLSALAFLLFVSSIRFFSGEPGWGPRYLTPVFAILWLLVPVGAARIGKVASALLLAMSLAVQIAGLSVDTMRFFSGDREAEASRFLVDPWLYFDLAWSQLLTRPGQVAEIATYDGPAATAFCPAPEPTLPWYVFVLGSWQASADVHDVSCSTASGGPDVSNPVARLREYARSRKPLDPRTCHVINSFRPWWAAYRYLPPGEVPVSLDRTANLLLLTAAAGLMLLFSSPVRAILAGIRVLTIGSMAQRDGR